MLIKIQRGLDLHLDGEPEPLIGEAAAVSSAALVGLDYENLRPAIAVAEGERVAIGQTLFTTKDNTSIAFTSPATGRVRAINRGIKRKLLSVVIDIDDDRAHTQTNLETFDPGSIDTAAAPRIREVLLASGLWTAMRARPFGAVANPDIPPRAIFVNAMRSGPLAIDPTTAMEGDTVDLAHGVACLATLCTRTFLCKAPELEIDRTRIGTATVVELVGPHPVGLSGTHINLLTTVGQQPDIWHIGYQEVSAIGKLLTTGVLDMKRIVALGGPCAKRPRLVRTRVGANLEDLLANEVERDARIVSGSPLSGRAIGANTDYLGRYDTQIALLREHAPPGDVEDATGSTSLNGWPSGMLSIEAFERVWPFDAPPIPLLRALIAQDIDTAQALGCLGFEEEDLALCSYLCPAKYDYGRALRATLEALRSEQ